MTNIILLSVILLAAVSLSAIGAWVFIRVREVGVKVMKIEFGQAQLRFAEKQFKANLKVVANREQIVRNLQNMPPPGRGNGPMSH